MLYLIDSIAGSVFIFIFVELDKHWQNQKQIQITIWWWDEQACLIFNEKKPCLPHFSQDSQVQGCWTPLGSCETLPRPRLSAQTPSCSLPAWTGGQPRERLRSQRQTRAAKKVFQEAQAQSSEVYLHFPPFSFFFLTSLTIAKNSSPPCSLTVSSKVFMVTFERFFIL